MNPAEEKEVLVEDPKPTEEEAEIKLDLEPEVEETVEELKAKLADAEEKRKKADEVANNYKIRAEKAERKPKELEKEPSVAGLSAIDTIALMRSNIAEEDIPEVVEYASFKKVSVAEALKSTTVKSILAQKDEERKVSAATNVGGARKGPSKVTDEQLLERAAKGVMPESDEDMRRMAQAALRKR